MLNRSTRRRNARKRANMLQSAAVTFTAIPLALGCAAVAAAIGANFAISMERAAAMRFDLVEIAGNGESDIRDYDLTADDCRAALYQVAANDRKAAVRFTCERATFASN